MRWSIAVVLFAFAPAWGGTQVAPAVGPNVQREEVRRVPLGGRGSGIPGRFVVTLEDRVDPLAVAREHGLQPDLVYTRVLNGFSGSIGEAARSGLLKDRRVVRVEQDQLVYGMIPAKSWGIDRIDQRSLPVDGQFNSSKTGAGVSIYIVDSGIRFDHQLFGGRAVRGIDTVGDGQSGSDCDGHGTHVAGIAGGSSGYGVAPGTRLISARVLDCQGSGKSSGVIAALDWIAANGARPGVVNMSIGGAAHNSTDDAVRRLITTGFTVIVAAGNENVDACGLSPARVTEAITVGASAEADSRASFSNYGSCLDMFAPGNAIISGWATGPTSLASASGTSMAAPHVAGAAALLLEGNSSLTPGAIQQSLISDATPNLIQNAQSAGNRLLFLQGGDYTIVSEGGVRTLKTSLQTYRLPSDVNNLVYTGTQRFTGMGNDLPNDLWGGPEGDYLIGYGGNDRFFGSSGAPNTFQGGTGDDLYAVEAGDSIYEIAGEGKDQVQTWLPYYELSENVEELIRTGTLAFTGIGSSGPNRIVGGPAQDYLMGRAGNDTLTGSAERDIFGYPGGDGSDAITDFDAGTGSTYVDRLDLRGRGVKFADIQMTDASTSTGTLVRFPGGDAVLLERVSRSNLGPEDFIF